MANEVYSQSWWGNGVCDNSIGWGIDYYDEAGCSPAFTNQYSMNFDGVDENFTFVRNATYDSVLKHSISVWFKCTSISGNAYLFDTGRHRLNFITSTNQLRYRIVDSPNTDDIRISGLTITDGNWHHVLACFDGSTQIAKVYYDGVLVNTKNPTSNVSTDPQLNYGIGASYLGSASYFNGNIDEVAFWHDTDQSANASAIYNGGTPADLSTLTPTNWMRMGDGATWTGASWQMPDEGLMSNTAGSNNMEEADRQTDTP